MNRGAELYGDRAAYLVTDRPGGSFVPVSYRQFRADVTALGTALIDAGYLVATDAHAGGGERRKFAIVSENRYEYVVAYFAVVCGGGVIVPIDPRLTAAEVAGLMRRSDALAIFYSKKYEAAVAELREFHDRPDAPDAHSAKCVKSVADSNGAPVNGEKSPDEERSHTPMDMKPDSEICSRIPMDEIPSLIARGKRLVRSGDDRYFQVKIDPRIMCSLLFTSGTTGAAKGVMLSQSNLMSNVTGMSAYINASGMTALSVLPMHHTLEFTCDILAAMYQGCTVAICEGLRYIMRDLISSGAEVIVGVPLVFEKMHRSIMKTAGRLGKYERLRGMIDFVGLTGGNLPARLMFRAVHKALGGKVKLFLVGGAPCDPEIIRDFNAMGIRMIQGYGMTENSPIITLGKDRCSKDDSVGLPLHGSFVQIDNADADGIGEIVISGPSVMLGYYGDEAATREAMPDGRLRTGDLGRFDEDGFLYITGRAKNVIVLQNGKNVYPEEVECHLLKSPFIAEAVVSGAAREATRGMALREREGAGHGANSHTRAGEGDAAGRVVTSSTASGAVTERFADIVVQAEIYPDTEAIRRAFGDTTADDARKVIAREIDKANEAMPPHMRVRRIVLRSVPFEKTTTKKIIRAT
jgi:long-chain acyl-CoA synthetase